MSIQTVAPRRTRSPRWQGTTGCASMNLRPGSLPCAMLSLGFKIGATLPSLQRRLSPSYSSFGPLEDSNMRSTITTNLCFQALAGLRASLPMCVKVRYISAVHHPELYLFASHYQSQLMRDESNQRIWSSSIHDAPQSLLKTLVYTRCRRSTTVTHIFGDFPK